MNALVQSVATDYSNVLAQYTKPLEFYVGKPQTMVQQQFQARANRPTGKK